MFYLVKSPLTYMKKINIDEFLNLWTGYILILEPYKKLPVYDEHNYIVSILKEAIYNNKKIIINLFSLTLIVTLFTCIYSYYFKVFRDKPFLTAACNIRNYQSLHPAVRSGRATVYIRPLR